MVTLTDAGVSTAPWFAAGHTLKEHLELGVEQLYILATENLGHKITPFLQHMSGYIQCLASTE